MVILSSDGINANHMSLYGYARKTTPFLDARVSEFRVFDNAFTNNGNTTGSITSLLTGMSPLATHVVYPPDMLDGVNAQRTLPRLLAGLGYYRSNWAVPHYADGRDQNMVGAFDVDNGYGPPGPRCLTPPGRGTCALVRGRDGGDHTAPGLGCRGRQVLHNPFAEVATVAGDSLGDNSRLNAVVDEISHQSRFFINSHFMATHGPVYGVTQPFWSRGEQKVAWDPDFYDDAIRQYDSYVGRVYDELPSPGSLIEPY